MEEYFDTETYLDEMQKSFEKAIDFMQNEFSSIRAGRANPRILDKILVDYWGSPTPINQMASISIPEARVLAISVWDQSALRSVVKAIQESDIGINPSDDGKMIRLNFPMLTEEKRKSIVKDVKGIAENSKVALRNARRECLDTFKEMKKDNVLSEDDFSSLEKEVQKILDNNIKNIDTMVERKEKEVMEI